MRVDELVDSLEIKIKQYRQAQKAAFQIKKCLAQGCREPQTPNKHLCDIISKQIEQLKQEASERVSAIGAFCNRILQKQRMAYQQETQELRKEITRQYKVITLMRQELEDLMAMLNERKSEGYCQQQNQNQPEQQQIENNLEEEKSQTINGLQIIEEEETDRTIMSSVHSLNEDVKLPQSDNFIRIEQKEKEDMSEQNQIESESSFNQPILEKYKEWNEKSQSEVDEWSSNRKFQNFLNSVSESQRQTYLAEPSSSEGPSQWDSVPLSSQGEQYVHVQNLWEDRSGLDGLRQITNESEKERQSKTKMFLEQFRKTFNKCLSSANVSRKNSKKDINRPPKDKSRTITTTFGKVEPTQSPKTNEKFISEMLKDIDNNNKFSVGSRRSELKYEGEKREGNRNGQGLLYYSNGLSYEGEFRNNLRHGFGILRFNQIEIYRGQWAADELSGQGKIRNFAVINKRKSMASSSPLSKWVSYCGSFRGNRFQGEGTLYLQGGEKFLGRFICGSACGQGTLYKKNGEVQSGVWRYNQLAEQF